MKPGAGLATLALAVFLCAALAGSLIFAAQVFMHLPIDLGLHGWIALIGGGVLTIGLSFGLMGLAFFSARHGHDEAPPADPES